MKWEYAINYSQKKFQSTITNFNGISLSPSGYSGRFKSLHWITSFICGQNYNDVKKTEKVQKRLLNRVLMAHFKNSGIRHVSPLRYISHFVMNMLHCFVFNTQSLGHISTATALGRQVGRQVGKQSSIHSSELVHLIRSKRRNKLQNLKMARELECNIRLKKVLRRYLRLLSCFSTFNSFGKL